MTASTIRAALVLVGAFCWPEATLAQVINGTGSYKGAGPGWDRGMETTMHCGNNPESWVRGSASLNTESGVLSMIVQLETDSVLAGPKGRVAVAVRAADGGIILNVSSEEIGIGGKAPGKAVIREFKSSITIPLNLARQARSLYLDAQCTGSVTRLFDIDLADVAKSFGLIATDKAHEATPGSVESRNLVTVSSDLAKATSNIGSPSYTAAMREAISLGGILPKGIAVSPSSIDLDSRYRTNFMEQGRIWGGQAVVVGTFPDTVAVAGNGGICSGTLIAPKTILTAAHCYCDGVAQTVYFGDSMLNAITTGQVAEGKTMIPCSPEFHIENGDVAVLTLKEASSIPPRAFASSTLIGSAKTGRAVGFGVGSNPVADPAGIKRLVDVPMASIACNATVSSAAGTVPDAQFYRCTAGREIVAGAPSLDKDSCNGDSGGPLFVQGADGGMYLAATTSRATGTAGMRACGDGGIYVRTDGQVMDWIRSLGVHTVIATGQ